MRVHHCHAVRDSHEPASLSREGKRDTDTAEIGRAVTPPVSPSTTKGADPLTKLVSFWRARFTLFFFYDHRPARELYCGVDF